MAEYIDRKAVRERLERVFKLQAQTAKKLVDDIPTADVKPIVHGEWIEKEVFTARGNVDMLQSARCNKCGRYHTTPYSYYFTDYNFCPNCGADTRKGEEE